MVLRKWLLFALLALLAAFAYRIISAPIAPDIGTPGIITPPQPSPRDTPETFMPMKGLNEQRLQMPARWRTSLLENRVLRLPKGFKISVYASGLPNARFMALDDKGNLYVSQPNEGKISVVIDGDRDGIADKIIAYADDLNLPHGLAFDGGWLYVAENDRVERLMDINGDLRADEKERIVKNIPGPGGHFTRTIGFGPDGMIYVSVGSSCNICEDDPRRAAILRFNKDGSGDEIYASGLRNSVGFVWRPGTKELWATDNGRDLLGDDLPPDEINIVEEGKHYGWPYCYGQRIPDPQYRDANLCATTVPPAVELQAHSAPLGLRFYVGDMFPEMYRGDLFVAYHGSWNRKVPTGYKVVRIHLNGKPIVEDFIVGWLMGEEKWGRPVDIIVGEDGSMYISDDHAGTIYRVIYEGASR